MYLLENFIIVPVYGIFYLFIGTIIYHHACCLSSHIES